jgi:hypothetical protein
MKTRTAPRPKTVTMISREKRLVREALVVHAVMVLRCEERRFPDFHRAAIALLALRETKKGAPR